jgi:hypothetical protein
VDVAVFEVVESELSAGGAQVALLEEETSEFTRVVRPVQQLSHTEAPDIELSSFN